jgi:hypothetical protein
LLYFPFCFPGLKTIHFWAPAFKWVRNALPQRESNKYKSRDFVRVSLSPALLTWLGLQRSSALDNRGL